MNSEEVRKRWAERSGAYSPDYYAYYGPDEASESVRALVEAHAGPARTGQDRPGPARAGSGPAVLELGCSSGRHLAHLREHGYEDLHGVEINDDAFEVMADAYPELAATATFRCDAIQDAVADFADDRFDAVFTVETLQHLHPDDEWVFGELARITSDLLVTVENEGGGDSAGSDDRDDPAESDVADEAPGSDADDVHGSGDPAVSYVDGDFPLYYRDWNRVFTQRGFVEVASESLRRTTLRAFRPAGE